MRASRSRHQLLTVGELTRAYVDGDTDALAELMHRLRRVPLGAARQHNGSLTEAEDIAQETWLRFMVHAGDIRDPDRLVSWLWVTAANEARRRGRREARLRLVERLDDVPADEPEQDRITADCRDAVDHAARARLNDSERELFALLIDRRGLDYQQISASCARPVGAIGPTRGRIIRKLRSHPDVVRACGALA
jgi:RNA polymerase sigma factor (sigma-70 family)